MTVFLSRMGFGMCITMTRPAARGTRAVTGLGTLVVHVCSASGLPTAG